MVRERADARRNRDRLLEAARDAFRRGGGSVQLADVARAAADPDPIAAVAMMLRQLLDAQFGLHGMSRVLTAAVDAQPETTEAKARLDVAMGAVLTRAQRAGRVRADVTAADLRALLGGIELAADRRDPAARTRADQHLAILLDGLKAGARGK